MAPRSPEEMTLAVAASLEKRTGRDLEEWITVVRESGIDPRDQNSVRRWLKAEHDIGQNSQWAIARATALASGWTPPTTDERIDRQYEDGRAHLRPIFERVRKVVEGFGDDVTMEGRKSYVPFVRARQFLVVAAATNSRVDLGIRYVEAPDSGLLDAGRAPGQGTHKLSLTSPEEVTDEVVELLRAAYEQNG